MNLLIPRNPTYGWITDLPDQRDFSYEPLTLLGLPSFLEKIDLRNFCSPVENQENLGSWI
jgi:hypothetical protein